MNVYIYIYIYINVPVYIGLGPGPNWHIRFIGLGPGSIGPLSWTHLAKMVLVLGPSGSSLVPGSLGVFDYFGEAALLDGGLRTATATSVGRIEVLSLTRNTWNELVEQGILGPDIASVLTAKALEQSEERKGRGGVGDVDVDQDDEIMEIQDY